MGTKRVTLAFVFAAGLACGVGVVRLTAQSSRDPTCGAASAPQVRTTLYFGTARHGRRARQLRQRAGRTLRKGHRDGSARPRIA